MNTRKASLRAFLLALLLPVLLTGAAAAAPTIEQGFLLQPGWNAIFLELEPLAADTETAFAGLPIESVWAFNPSLSTLDFVQNPQDLVLDLPGWLHYVPAGRPEALLNNLFLLQANKAYLIHLEGGAPVTWRVVGRPKLEPQRWLTDSFTLTGFRVDPAAPPSFGAYLAPSAAHAGQPVYRLDPSGVWRLVAHQDLESIRPGEAYWVYTRGASVYQGPLEVETPSLGGIDFGGGRDQATLILRNRSGRDTTLEVRRLDSPAAVPLYHRFNTGDLSKWQRLPSPLRIEADAGREVLVDLGVRRAELSAALAESILEVKNGLGTRLLLLVAATAASTAAAPSTSLDSSGAAGNGHYSALVQASVTSDLSGLWVGDVTVGAVSESRLAGQTPTTTPREFRFRVLLHVDGGGQVRLLKSVIQMWQNGTLVPSATDPGFSSVGVPGRFVLITDDSRIPDFAGASLRDGVPVGVRLSTAAYDFPGNAVEVAGNFGPGQSLSWDLELASDAPTNPFRHQFHPDHDNLDEKFLGTRVEAFPIRREMRLALEAQAPAGASLGWGATEIGGVFEETIEGLHHHPIHVAGKFELKRTVLTPVLNQ